MAYLRHYSCAEYNNILGFVQTMEASMYGKGKKKKPKGK